MIQYMVSFRLRIALVSLAALALFVLFVGRADIAGPHEARVAQVARRMAQSGWPWQARLFPVVEVEIGETDKGKLRLMPRADGRMLTVNPWMIPVIGHDIRLQKPPLPYWCSATAFLVMGTSEFAARLTPALLGAISVLLFYGLAVALLGRRGGWLATLVYLTSYFVSQEYRKVMADPFLAFFTLLSLWAWVMACRRRSTGLTILFYVALALGALAKGPVLFVHVAVPMVAWRIFVGDKLPGRWLAHVVGACLFAALTLPWVLYVVSHIPGAMEIWRYESIGELTDNVRNARPFWVYLSIFYLAMPWTPLWIGALIAPWIRKRRRLWFAWTWCIVMVLFFSLLVNLKKDAYLLPIMPAVALMSGAALLGLMAAGRTARNARLFKTVMTMQIGIGIAAGLVLMYFLRDVPLLAGIAALTGGLALLWKGRPERWLGLQILVYFVISMLYVSAYLPLSQNRGSARYFAPAAMAEQARSGLRFLPDQVTEGMAFYFPLDIPTATAGESPVLAIAVPKRGREVIGDWGSTYDATVIPLEPAKNMNGFKLYELTRNVAATTRAATPATTQDELTRPVAAPRPADSR